MHVQNYQAKQAAKSASVDDEVMSHQKKPINDLSVLVGIGREILFVLKCILGLLVCLVLLRIVLIVCRLQ
jgi:hypothetical protein